VLYDRTVKEGIPFYQWFKWLETTLNAEVLKHLISNKPKPKDKNTQVV
jgi:hypothetical protein